MRRGPHLDRSEARALAIVEACLDLEDAGERAQLIAERCGADAPLAARVGEILAMEATAGELLPTGGARAGLALDEVVPERIDKFRVLGTIARGGMGTVVRAERDDGLYAQMVAIKLIRADLVGPRLAAHFAEERRLLARLTHPSIARILDGGEENGRPWLAMEYVEGVPVTEWLAAQSAGVAETLDAFAAIAEAVSHAHRNLVVHGDIKPANIFATPEGTIKLLDFGVGRLVDRIEPATGSWPLSRGYAAPERLAGEPPSIAGDVYSLGVLLHEMLAGALPVAGQAMSVTAVAQGGQAKALRGDLDAIVAQILHADPAQRYPDVAALLADLHRYRRLRPVSARPQTFRYVAGRWLRRNRLPVAVAATLLLVVSVAAAISLGMYLDARRQRLAAEARAEQLRSLASYQLFSLYDQLAEVPGSLNARSRLAGEAQVYLDQLAARPDASPQLRLDTAAGYNRLAEIQGVPSRPNIGLPGQVKANLARARTLLDRLSREAPGRTVTRQQALNRLYAADFAIWHDTDQKAAARLLAEADALVARIRDDSPDWRALERFRRQARLDHQGWSEQYAAEVALARDTLRWLATVPEAEQRSTEGAVALARTHAALSEGQWGSGDHAGALESARRGDAVIRAELARHPDAVAALATRLSTGYTLVTTLEALGRSEGLVAMGAELVETARHVRTIEPRDRLLTGRARNIDGLYAQLLAQAGRTREALGIQQALVAADLQRFRAAPDDSRALRDTAFSHRVLGTLYRAHGEPARACRAWREAAARLDAMARRGNLSEWDRSNVLRGVRSDLKQCRS